MRSLRHAALAAAAVLLAGTAAAHAGTYSVTVNEGITNGTGFSTAAGVPTWYDNGGSFSLNGLNYGGTASATFTYTGALNFDNNTAQNQPSPTGDLNSAFGFSTSNISNYSGANTIQAAGQTIANYNSLAGFLASSGSAAGFTYGSYYTFDLGTIAAGTQLTITHDDGISLFDNGSQLAGATDGPTTSVTDTVTVGSTGDVILRYSRQNGTPSILEVSVPEPASLALLGAGLVGLGAIRRRRSTRA